MCGWVGWSIVLVFNRLLLQIQMNIVAAATCHVYPASSTLLLLLLLPRQHIERFIMHNTVKRQPQQRNRGRACAALNEPRGKRLCRSSSH